MDGMVGEGLLRALAAHADGEFWVQAWKAVAFLGSATFYTALIPLAFAATPRRWALRLTLLFAASATLAEGLKAAFGRARPDVVALGLTEPLEHLGAFENDAFPSGHALMATVLWGFVVLRTRNPLLRAVMLSGILAISLSRLALLRHDLLDIAGGWIFGLACLALLHGADRAWGASLAKLPPVEQAGLWLLTALALQLAIGLEVTAIVLGVAAGLGVGAVTANRNRWRETRLAWGWIGTRAVLGWGVALFARDVAQPGGEWSPLALFGIYALAGMWIAGLLPTMLGGLWVRRWD